MGGDHGLKPVAIYKSSDLAALDVSPLLRADFGKVFTQRRGGRKGVGSGQW